MWGGLSSTTTTIMYSYWIWIVNFSRKERELESHFPRLAFWIHYSALVFLSISWFKFRLSIWIKYVPLDLDCSVLRMKVRNTSKEYILDPKLLWFIPKLWFCWLKFGLSCPTCIIFIPVGSGLHFFSVAFLKTWILYSITLLWLTSDWAFVGPKTHQVVLVSLDLNNDAVCLEWGSFAVPRENGALLKRK